MTDRRMFSAADTESFVDQFGFPVVFGSHTTLAIFDRPDTVELGGRVQTTGYRIQYPSNKLPGLGHGSQVVIGIGPDWRLDASCRRLQYVGDCPERAESGTFRVQGTPALIDDGAFTEATLERLE